MFRFLPLVALALGVMVVRGEEEEEEEVGRGVVARPAGVCNAHVNASCALLVESGVEGEGGGSGGGSGVGLHYGGVLEGHVLPVEMGEGSRAGEYFEKEVLGRVWEQTRAYGGRGGGVGGVEGKEPVQYSVCRLSMRELRVTLDQASQHTVNSYYGPTPAFLGVTFHATIISKWRRKVGNGERGGNGEEGGGSSPYSLLTLLHTVDATYDPTRTISITRNTHYPIAEEEGGGGEGEGGGGVKWWEGEDGECLSREELDGKMGVEKEAWERRGGRWRGGKEVEEGEMEGMDLKDSEVLDSKDSEVMDSKDSEVLDSKDVLESKTPEPIPPPPSTPSSPPPIPSVLKVLSYNVWNSNPPGWLVSGGSRWERYSGRLDLLHEVSALEDADVIGFQEVRLDVSLGRGSQAVHLWERFREYQYVSQSACAYVGPHSGMGARDEEGMAIFSKFPIVHSDYALLSRNPKDKQDEHQRAVLHAVIAHPNPALSLIDVYVTHGPLSPQARERTAVETLHFMQASRRGKLQLFLGDLNAEPHEPVPQFWTEKVPLGAEQIAADFKDAFLDIHPEPTPASKDQHQQRNLLTFPSDNPTKRIDFILYGSNPPTQSLPTQTQNTSAILPNGQEEEIIGEGGGGGGEGDGGGGEERGGDGGDGEKDQTQTQDSPTPTPPPPSTTPLPPPISTHLFPYTPLPPSSFSSSSPVTTTAVDLIGQDPKEGTVPRQEDIEDPIDSLGMVHKHSPLWASDHRGLVATFEINKE